jgi:hypothetical protein
MINTTPIARRHSFCGLCRFAVVTWLTATCEQVFSAEFIPLGVSPQSETRAITISDDGSVVSGVLRSLQGGGVSGVPFRWTRATGKVALELEGDIVKCCGRELSSRQLGW